MADSPSQPWTNNPNAPKITYDLYFREKATFSGVLIGSILYGTPKAPLSTLPRLSLLTPFIRLF